LGMRAKLSARVVVIVGTTTKKKKKKNERMWSYIQSNVHLVLSRLAVGNWFSCSAQLLRVLSNNNTTKRMEGSEYLQGNGRLWILWVHMICVGPRTITLDSVGTGKNTNSILFFSCWALYYKCVEPGVAFHLLLLFSFCLNSVLYFLSLFFFLAIFIII
jgi:hypothetical protein